MFWDNVLHGVAVAAFDAEGLGELGAVDTDGHRRKGDYLRSEAVDGWTHAHPRHRWRRE